MVTLVLVFGCRADLAETGAPTDSAPPADTAAASDRDGDGTPDVEDCAPDDAARQPGAPESCNGLDDDCDGVTDEPDAVDAIEWFVDADGDGWGSAAMWGCTAGAGEVVRGGDCDDTNPLVFPDSPEQCDGLDQDCDGAVDEACTGAPVGNLSSSDATMTLWGDVPECDGWSDVWAGIGDDDNLTDLVYGTWCDNIGAVVLESAPFRPDDVSDRLANVLVWDNDHGQVEAAIWDWRDAAGAPTSDLLTLQADARTEELLVALDVDPVPGSTHDDADLRVNIHTPGWTPTESLWRQNFTVLPGSDGPAIVLAADWFTGSDEMNNEVWVIDGGATGLGSTMDWPFLGPDVRDLGYNNNPWVSDAGDLDGDGFHELALNSWRGMDLYWGPLVNSDGERPYDLRYTAADGGNILDQTYYADLDGDGRDDWLVTTTDRSHDGQVVRLAGSARAPGESLTEHIVQCTYPTRCNDLARAIDLDADGALDLMIADTGYDTTTRDVGAVYVLYGPFAGTRDIGATGDAVIVGAGEMQNFGDSLASGDFNADGFGDFAVGNYLGVYDDHPGNVDLFFGGPR